MTKEYKNLITDEILSEVKIKELKENSMLLHRIDLWVEWDFCKNKNLDVFKVTKGSDKKAWWKCSKCNEHYYSAIQSRVRGVNCPYCRGLKASKNYNLLKIKPELAEEWSAKNKKSPIDYTPSSSESVWWLGKCGHTFKSRISDRKSGKSCPYCTHNPKVLIGFNDLNTTHSHIAELFYDKSDATKYTKGSGKIAKFKCACGNVLKKRISDVVNNGLSCPICSDGVSFGEKVVYNLLKEYNVEFRYDSKLTWSKNKRYDFILNDYDNAIIEVHGEQHVSVSTGNFSTKNLEFQIKNDEFKRNLAKSNGVINYFEIHVENRNSSQLIDSLNKSGLIDLLKLKSIDWNKIIKKSQKSMIILICEYYSANYKSTADLSKIFKFSEQTIIKYLKIGNELGICEYVPHSTKNKNITKAKMSKAVNQYTLEGKYIRTFESIGDASDHLNIIRNGNISKCCKGLSNSYKGYIWKYANEFAENLDIPKLTRKDEVAIVKLTLNYELVEVFESVKKAKQSVNGTVNISKCCNGEYSQSKGYRWMYLEDYKNKKTFLNSGM